MVLCLCTSSSFLPLSSSFVSQVTYPTLSPYKILEQLRNHLFTNIVKVNNSICFHPAKPL